MSNNVIEQNITETLESNYMPYAMSVIISRAIPEIDGFKPSHRKLLYTMYKMGLLNGGRRKSADIVGQTMLLNPHGDGAIYETMVRLTRGNAALLHPFIDSKGNFGKQYSRDMAYAASRYTEAKLDDICHEIFADIDKNTVEFVDNYNGTTKEPLLFPTTFPNLLVTPNQGIAVGMASSVCSFNLREVCELTIQYIKDKNIDMLEVLKAPDFSTGGELIYNRHELENIYKTGRGSVKVRAKYRFDKKNSCIDIYEIPYTTTVEVIIDKIVNLVKSGKLREITDVRDETDLKGLKITIDIKKSANPDVLMHRLFSQTSLSDNFSCNFNFLVDGKPKVMGIGEILDHWLNFRHGCLRRQTEYDLLKKEERLHLLEGLGKIVLDIDKAIHIIRNTEENKMVIPRLMEGFQIDEGQAEFIAEIKLRNLNKEYLLDKINETEALKKDIENLRKVLNDPKQIDKIIIKQLREIAKKYGKDRMTGIIYEDDTPDIKEEDLIADYGVKFFLSRDNYFKKISLASLRSSGEQTLKEKDVIITELEANNKSEVIFFSNRYCAYKMKAYDLPDCKASSLGEYLPNVLHLEEDEKIIYMVATATYEGSMLFAFENGKMAKINMKSYATKVNRKKLLNAYGNKSPLVFIQFIPEDTTCIAIRDLDKATLFHTSLIPLNQTKSSSGIQIVTLKKNSKLSKVLLAESFISDDIEYYRTQKIPTSGHFLTEKDKVANNLTSVEQIFLTD